MIRERRNTGRSAVSLFISISLHVGFGFALAVLPKHTKQDYSLVKMEITQPEPELKPEPELEPEPEPEPEPVVEPKPKKPKPKVRTPKEKPIPNEPPAPLAPPEPEPEPVPEPEKIPEAPPVFDLGNNSFAAGKGQDANWSLNRSEGNTKFAPIQKPGTESSRGTRATGIKNGTPGGTGNSNNRPIPFNDLSKRPEPRNGPIKLPPYPPDAKREGIEGLVVLQVYIDRTGRVRKVRVVKDPGGGLGTVARNAMLQEVWTPPLNKSGIPVDTVIIYRYRFVLES